ncbi:MAG: helix-turn-helix transcriptional regulator [Sphingomonadales bacterium]|nr:helix-turn-helix transcriptional regulator [Sphingomonadales bacterium]
MEVGLIGALDKHGSDHLGLCLPGPDAGSTARLQEAVTLCLPHIQRAVRIARRIGEAELSAAHSAEALNLAPSPVLLLTETLELAFANAGGHALIAELGLANGNRLRLGTAALHDDLVRLLDPDGPCHCRPFRLATGAPGERAAMAMRINPERISGADTANGQARLMIVAAHNPAVTETHIDHLRDWFGLTHAEARLAAMLADGGSTEDYCQLRGVSANATRFLLKGIFAKTGVNRQSQLVQLIDRTPLHWSHDLPTGDLPSPI